MINNNTKEVILNGESYDLSFNFGVMKNICKETGLAISEISRMQYKNWMHKLCILYY